MDERSKYWWLKAGIGTILPGLIPYSTIFFLTSSLLQMIRRGMLNISQNMGHSHGDFGRGK